MSLSTRHLLGIKDLTVDDISLILSTAEQFKEVLQRPVKKVPSLRDVTIVNLFYENSTRTRFSFELAEKRLSADTINFAVSGSSAAKGETLLDTVRNILSMVEFCRSVISNSNSSDLQLFLIPGFTATYCETS